MNYLLNKYQHIGSLALLVLMVATTSCSDLASVNDDGNDPSSAAPPYLLTSAEKSLADNYWDEFPLGYFGNLYAQYWSQNQYTDESRYAYREGVVNDIWDDYYTTLNTLQQIIRQNHNDPTGASAFGNNANQIAIAKVLKAWTLQTLTDIWGDIPYNNILQGAANPSPAYTPQDSVYMGIIQMLTEASDSINVNAPGITSGDIIYDGDMVKWKKLANSLKMRAAIRIADTDLSDLAKTSIQQAVSDSIMTSNDDNALFKYKVNVPNNNPINEAYKTRRDYAISKPLLDLMQNNSDPRIPIYADPAKIDTSVTPADTIYAGFPYGMSQSAATVFNNTQNWSEPGAITRAADAPAILMTYSEVAFIEAEAAQRNWITEDAGTNYDEAIKASMLYWGVSESKADNYISNNPYNAGNWEQRLGREKWVALYMQGIQGWAEWRRLDFGILQAPEGGKLGVNFATPVAVRYPYPQDEENSNGANVEAAISNQGFSKDDQGQRVWWDVSANSAQ